MTEHELTSSPVIFRSPKRNGESRTGRSGWYKYYAGFSPSFVQDALAATAAKPGTARLMDPWNGSGTTTEVGIRNGFDSVGFDLNPVMVIVAKARTLNSNVEPSINSLLEKILLTARTVHHEFADDPLKAWLCDETARSIRRIEQALQMILVNVQKYTSVAALPSLNSISALAAFFYVALFRSLREILTSLRSSNPTWIKNAQTAADLVRVPYSELISLIRTQTAQMSEGLAAESFWVGPRSIPKTVLDKASSLCLPLDSASIQLVVTSPPYCTRIDYAVKTGPELALLGLGDVRPLRDQMIGTPTIVNEPPISSRNWGKTCLNLLDKVSGHKSRASKSYYLKTQNQYFDGLYKSLIEIDRTLADSAECFFVVQDSFYKELHIDLAQILKEMGSSVGWSCNLRRDFPSSRTMVRLNRGARAYNNPKLAIESVLHFTKMQRNRACHGGR